MSRGEAWGRVMQRVLLDPNLEPATKALYALMAAHADHATGEVFLSQSRAAQAMRMHRETVRRHLAILVQRRILAVTEARKGRAAVYRVTDRAYQQAVGPDPLPRQVPDPLARQVETSRRNALTSGATLDLTPWLGTNRNTPTRSRVTVIQMTERLRPHYGAMTRVSA